MEKFSVIISVYKNDEPRYFDLALKSIINQTEPPSEIILVQDGPVTAALTAVINKYKTKYDIIHHIIFENNLGLGEARKRGVEECKYKYIATMDSDDISVTDRFEKQLNFLEANPDIDILGGQINEFIENENNLIGRRQVPLSDTDIKRYLQRRCPLNHVTVMFKRDAVLKAGNYQHWHYDEDYFLWCRMHLAGAKFANLPDVLVLTRVGIEMYQRRGGWKYFKSEAKLMWWMYRHKITDIPLTLYNITIRFILQVCMPNKLRGYIFRKYARKQV